MGLWFTEVDLNTTEELNENIQNKVTFLSKMSIKQTYQQYMKREREFPASAIVAKFYA
jgi:peptidase E